MKFLNWSKSKKIITEDDLDRAFEKGHALGFKDGYNSGFQNGIHENGVVIRNFQNYQGKITCHAFCPVDHTIPIYSVLKETK